MMMTMMTPPRCLALAACGLIACCGKPESVAAPEPDGAPPSARLGEVLAATPEGEPGAIHLVRMTAQPGDPVTVRGRVMGNASPFVEGRAAFILGDPEVLTSCDEIPGDGCESPWDACCDSPEDKLRGTATIQVIDAGGQVLQEGIEGRGGVEKLASLTVSGTVAEGSSPAVLVINAQAIEVAR